MKCLPDLFSCRREWDWGLFLSHDLHPVSFFETQILNRLRVNQNLTILIDRENKAQVFSESGTKPRYAGVHYNLEGAQIRGGGRFHPKLYLLVADDSIYMSMGSFNLTQSGLKKNLELVVTHKFRQEGLTIEESILLWDIRQFLSDTFLSENSLLTSLPETVSDVVREILDTPMFGKLAAPSEDTQLEGQPRFLYSTEEPIFSQVLRHLGGDIDRVKVLSPFFDDRLAALGEVIGADIDCDLYLQGENSMFPKSTFEDATSLRERTRLFLLTVESGNISSRTVHAKKYRFECESGVWDLVTSANFSSPGFTNDVFPRNLECGLLFEESPEARFITAEDVMIQRLEDLAALSTRDRDAEDEPNVDTDRDRQNVLAWAVYKDPQIRFKVDEAKRTDVPGSLLAELRVGGQKIGKHAFRQQEGVCIFEPEVEIGGAGALELSLVDPHSDWQSVRISISRTRHKPNQLPTLGASAFGECVQIGGWEGIQKAFDLAEEGGQKDWLFNLLNRWDLTKILEGRPQRADETERTESIIPSLSSQKSKKQSQKRIKKNLRTISEPFYLRHKLEDYLQDVRELSESAYLEKFNDYVFPLVLAVTEHFYALIQREEQKKEKNRWLTYPDYTWKNNYKVYVSYALLILQEIEQLLPKAQEALESASGETWLFLGQTQLWAYGLHTEKTRNNLREELTTLWKSVEKTRKLSHQFIEQRQLPSDEHEQLKDILNTYDYDEDFLLS